MHIICTFITLVKSKASSCFKRDYFYHVKIVKPILLHKTFMITTVQLVISFVSTRTKTIKITMKYYNTKCKYITSIHSSVSHLPVREEYLLYCSPFCISMVSPLLQLSHILSVCVPLAQRGRGQTLSG